MELGKTTTITYADDELLPRPGDTLGHFRIERELGKGGFGSVFSAFDTRLERKVAIKVPRLRHLPKWHAEIFVREARAAAQLRDPNIVSVHEVGRDKDRLYIVSDLIDGVTLREWIDQSNPDFWSAAKIVSTIAKSVHRAHQNGIIHRDIKPRNILVDFEGQPHLTDFGLAKRENPDEITLTSDGNVIGTPAYMSPEQIMGKSNEADARTDVYALGVVLYEILTRTRPFRGESDLLVNEISAGSPTPPRTLNRKVPRDLEAICLKAMACKPSNRFKTALEFSNDLDRFLAGLPTVTRPPNLPKRALLIGLKYWVPTTIVVLISIVLVAWANRPKIPAPKELQVRLAYEPIDAKVEVYSEAIGDQVGLIPIELLKSEESIKGGMQDISLPPGLYRISLRHPSFGTQWYIRRVPPDDSEIKNLLATYPDGRLFASEDWTKIGHNAVRLSPMVMKPVSLPTGNSISLGPEKLRLITGGTFNPRNPEKGPMDLRPTAVTVEDFFIAEHEVTIGNFQTVMGYVPKGLVKHFGTRPVPTDWPVSFVTWLEAVEYCEKIGTRLPTVNEYCYVASNQGANRFPWGDSIEPFMSWTDGPVGKPDYDVSKFAPPVHNLFSGCLEWTMELEIPFQTGAVSAANGRRFPDELILQWVKSRVVVGGEEELIGNAKIDPAKSRNVKTYLTRETHSPLFGIGFRTYLDAD